MKLYTEQEIAQVRESGKLEEMARILFEFQTRKAKMAPRMKLHRRRIPRKDLTHAEQVRFVAYFESLWKITSDLEDLENYLVFWLMHNMGFSPGEVVGNQRNGSNLPGFQIGDLQSDGIFVHRKKGGGRYFRLPADIVEKMRIMVGGRKKTGDELKDKIFLIGFVDPVGTLDHRTKIHAEKAGLEGFKFIQPTAYRRAVGTRVARKTNKNLSETRDVMGLQNAESADRYVERMEPERQDEILLEENEA